MVPHTYPSTFDASLGQTEMVVYKLSSVVGMQRWSDYIPIKYYGTENVVGGNTSSYININNLNDITGKQAWVDYVPVYEEPNASDAWSISATGYIPYGSALAFAAFDTLRRLNGTLVGVSDDFVGSFIDSTGTQPVTAIGDLVGLTLDRMGTATERFSASGVTAGAVASGSFIPGLSTTTSLVTGRLYRITYTITACVGQLSAGASSTAGTAQTINWTGTYSECIASPATGSFNIGVQARGAGITSVTGSVTVTEITGNHATQATTASKPLVTRVPKRLGPNLVVNGGFDTDTAWTKGTGWSISAGKATHAAGTGSLITNISGAQTTPGKTYQVECTISGCTAGSIQFDTSGVTSTLSSSGFNGRYVTTVGPTINTSSPRIWGTTSFDGSVDDVVVQEVLEWSPALDFDGSNDLLTLGSGAILQQGSDHFVTAAFVLDAVGVEQAIYGSCLTGQLRRVAYLNVSAGNALRCLWLDNAGTTLTLTGPTLSAGVPYVATAAKIGSNYFLWLNGVQVATNTATFGTTTVDVAYIGCFIGAQFFLNGKLIDIAIDQGTLTDNDRKVIERAMAQKAGVDYAF